MSWIVANGAGTMWRAWGDWGFEWTQDRDLAIQYTRRGDAEKVHAEDLDAWLIQEYDSPTNNPAEVLRGIATDLAQETGLEVDHAAFDEVAAQLEKPLPPVIVVGTVEEIGEELTLPCAVRLPSGMQMSAGVKLSTFLLACERQFAKDFAPPPPGPDPELKPFDRDELMERIGATSKGALIEAAILTEALRDQHWDVVINKAITKLPHPQQLDIAQALLSNLGMVAVRSETAYGHGDEIPVWVQALRSYALDVGFIVLPTEVVADIEAILKEVVPAAADIKEALAQFKETSGG